MKFKIGTWNISECTRFMWSLATGITKKPLTDYVEMADEIADTIIKLDLDVICLQECPILINDSEDFFNLILEKSGLKHFACIATCPSFLMENGRVGIAILSKFPLNGTQIRMFNNPQLKVISKSGRIYRSFDKAIMFTEIASNVVIMTCHAIAFLPFGKEPMDYPDSFAPLRDTILQIANENKHLVFAGDLNMDGLIDMFPELGTIIEDKVIGSTITEKFHEGKHYPDLKQDSIFITSGVDATVALKTETFSDHYLCSCECEI